MLIIKTDAPTEWLLVKVPRITNKETGANCTAQRLRETVRENHFGGGEAPVRRLAAAEVAELSRRPIGFTNKEFQR